ncbi:hypothetical protein [Candidatus Electronema sp. PJ]
MIKLSLQQGLRKFLSCSFGKEFGSARKEFYSAGKQFGLAKLLS